GINLDSQSDEVDAVALQRDGKILIAGATPGAVHPNDAVVWRLKADGGTLNTLNDALDTTFDTDGQADFENGGSEGATGIAVQPPGKILLSGFSILGAR